jgi:hypothetical protein
VARLYRAILRVMSAGDHSESETVTEPVIGSGAADSGETLGERPSGDKLARAMSRARIAEALFAHTEPVKLGRYQLLELVGSGGMGVVWGAWDPELDRRVAIKLLKAAARVSRDRIVREGQALARLSHPNVVAVFDVGVVDDQVYLVMEWVRGENLRGYCAAPHSVAELVAVYRAAGEGLAAAHRAGLIHRDFKPENAILGDDGRVRVLDFGLARDEPRGATDGGSVNGGDDARTTELSRCAGTPHYMPPEQADGTAITPAVDQYALCVSLREALVGRRGDGAPADVPSWLARILDRGTAPTAGDRHASIDELLRALARDPATVWRRRALAAGAIAAIATAFVVGTQRAAPEADRCTGAAQELAASWNPDVRGRIAAHLTSLGAYGTAEAERLGTSLDHYGERWTAAHRSACLARSRDEISADHYQRDLGCLARTRTALDTLVDVLSRVAGEQLADAAGAAGALPDAGQCLGDTRDTAIDTPPADLTAKVAELDNEVQRVEVLARAVAPQAVERAEAAVGAADKLGYTPLIARALWVEGVALSERKRFGEAATVLARAADRAFAARDHRTAILAYAQELHAATRETDPARRPNDAAALPGAIPIVTAIADGLGPPGSHERAFLYNSIGTVHLMGEDRASARRAFEQASREQAHSSNQVDLGWIWANLAIVTDDPAERERLFGRATIELERTYGPDHPSVLSSRLQAAYLTPDADRASAAMMSLSRRYAALHPHQVERLANYWFEIGQIMEERDNPVGVLDAFVELPAGREETRIANGYLLLMNGKHGDAIAEMTRFADEQTTVDHLWRKMRASDALYVAGKAELALRRTTDAVVTLRRALDLLGRAERPTAQRRRARIQSVLAPVLAPSEPDQARTLADEALAWSRAAGGYDARVAALTALVAGLGSR